MEGLEMDDLEMDEFMGDDFWFFMTSTLFDSNKTVSPDHFKGSSWELPGQKYLK